MRIKCTNCRKTFEIDEKLIPDNGRLLQCGKCDHQWFYNREKFEETNEKLEVNLNQSFDDESILEKQIKSNKKEKKNNFLKSFLVLVITFVALIIVVDTFKIQIKTFYPEIDDLLNSLYQTLTDINLFFKDLIN